MKTGYSGRTETEPLILEPEDWTPDEWRTLCKLAGNLPPIDTERIVIKGYTLEYFIKENKKAPPLHTALELYEQVKMYRNGDTDGKILSCTIDLMETAARVIDRLADVFGDEDRTYIVTEVCPNCEAEIEMRWNSDVDGYKMFCPVCGEQIMLCDDCRHTDDHGCDYDCETNSCRRERDE